MPAPVLRVFVSSTWIDLQPERRAVEVALGRLRETKFIGMEHFGSRDDSPREASILDVDPTDLYVAVIGGRYGSGIVADEYQRARELGLDCFIYFKNEDDIGPESQESDPDKAARLAELKEEMRRRHIVSKFISPDDLAARVTADLHRWIVDAYLHGVSALPTDYAARLENFLNEYLGTPQAPVPFGGRDGDLARLDAWLDSAESPAYALLAAPAGRGKSALLVRWVQRLLTRKDVAVAFVPVSVRFRTNLAAVTFPALTARLAALQGAQLAGGADTPVEMWRGLLSEHLARPLLGGRRLLVILDGVDEAADWEPGPDLFPGNPPRGLRVLLSARFRAGDLGAASWLGSLGWDRPGLARDVDLAPLSVEGVADVLRRMGFPLDRLGLRVDVVGELHRLSEGDALLVRLYVDDLWRRGETATRLRPEDLAAVRPGLQGYFTRWWDDQRHLWGGKAPLREPAVQGLLNLLACALGPLSREDVFRLVPPEAGLTSWMLEETLRMLARFVIGDGRQLGFTFSHPRLGAYFYDRLSIAERTATERRLLRCGEETLAALNEGSLAPGDASPYVLQQYGRHLERSGRGADALRALLSDGWRCGREALEKTPTGFLADAERTWRAAEVGNQAAVEAQRPAPYIGTEVRCALCRASVKSLARNIPPALQKALVEAGVWTPGQGLDSARQVPDARQRVETFIALEPLMPEPLQRESLREAVAAAQGIEAADQRRSLLRDLAMRAARSDYPHQVLAVLNLVEVDDYKTPLALVPYLTKPWQDEIVRQALAAAERRGIGDYALAIAELAPFLSSAQSEDLFRHVCQLRQRPTVSAKALRSLAAHLSASALERMLAWAEEATEPEERATALTSLAPYVGEPSRQVILERALTAVDDLARPADCMRALAGLAPHLPEPLRRSTLDRALWVCQLIPGQGYADSLAELAPHLPAPLLAQALADADRIWNEKVRVNALLALAPHLPAFLVRETVESAGRLREPDLRDLALAGLAPYLGRALATLGDYPGPFFREIMLAVQRIRNRSSRVTALEAVVRHVPAILVVEARPALDTIRDPSERLLAVVALAQHLSADALREIFTEVEGTWDEENRAAALSALAPHLPRVLQGEAIVVSQGIERDSLRAKVLLALAPHLPEALLRDVLAWTRRLADRQRRASVLAELAPHLPLELLREALVGVRRIRDQQPMLFLFVSLAGHLPEPVRTKVLPRALAATKLLEDPFKQATALGGLMPHVREEMLDQALATAAALRPHARALALAPSVLHLTEPRRGEVQAAVLAAARLVENPYHRVTLLTAVARHVPESIRGQVLQQALGEALVVEVQDHRALSLAGLAPHLCEASLAHALTQVLALGNDNVRARLLTALAPSLRAQQLQQARKAAEALPESADRDKLLLNLAPELSESLAERALADALALETAEAMAPALTHIARRLSEPVWGRALHWAMTTALPVSSRHRLSAALAALVQPLANLPRPALYLLWREMLSGLASRTREDLFENVAILLPLLVVLGGPPAVAEVFSTVQDVCTWWP
jgi:hypothetical protein